MARARQHTGRAMLRSPAFAPCAGGLVVEPAAGSGERVRVLAVTLAAVSVSASGVDQFPARQQHVCGGRHQETGAVAVAGLSAVALADVGLSGSGAVGSSPIGGALRRASGRARSRLRCGDDHRRGRPVARRDGGVGSGARQVVSMC